MPIPSFKSICMDLVTFKFCLDSFFPTRGITSNLRTFE